MDNLFCGNLFPPPSSGGQMAAGLSSVLRDDGMEPIPGNAITIPGTAEK
jgi:hypothetical protein